MKGTLNYVSRFPKTLSVNSFAILTGWSTLVFKLCLDQDIPWGFRWPNMSLRIPARVSGDQEAYLSSNQLGFCPLKKQDFYPGSSKMVSELEKCLLPEARA